MRSASTRPGPARSSNRSFFTDARYEPFRRPGHIKVPFWLQPDRHYVGLAWYARTVLIPDSWRDMRLVLSLERPHWVTRVWLDDQEIGTCESLSTPHVYDLGAHASRGRIA